MIERTTVVRNGKEYVALNGLTRHDPGYEYTRRRSHAERFPELFRAKERRRQDRAREVILEAKRKPCVDCHQRHASYVLEFHHVRGKKLFSIGKAMTKNYSISVIKKEIAKCDLLCANCHRYRTHGGDHERVI